MARRATARAGAESAAVERVYAQLAAAAATRHPEAAAPVVEREPTADVVRFLSGLPPRRAVEVVRRFAPERAAELLVALLDEPSEEDAAITGRARAAALLAALPPRHAATLVARMDEGPREALLGALPAERGTQLRALVQYPGDTAGGRMDPRVAAYPVSALARSVPLRELRRQRADQVFLIDDEARLIGAVAIAEIVLAAADTPLGSLPREAPPSVSATMALGEVIETITRTGVASLAVVDFEGRVLGVLRQRELIAAARDDAAADLLTMVGASKEERALSPPLAAVRMRLPWLQVNLLTAFAASAVVGLFEDTIAKVTALAVLMPIVAGQSGNTGAQALAVTVRGLFMREVLLRDWLRVAWKELLVGTINGVAVGLVTSGAVFAWSRSFPLAAVIGTSMVASMAIAGVAGALVPVVLTSLKQDPAQSSSIVLTTVTDIAGFFSFLGIATLLLG